MSIEETIRKTIIDTTKELITPFLAELKPQVNDEQLIHIDHAAREIFVPAISRQSLSNWVRSGKLKAYKVNGRIYFKRSEILAAAKEIKIFKRA